MIEFPCPEPIAKMTLSKGKWTCNSCDQELIEVNPFDEKPTGRCVISSEPPQFKYSINKFALALLLGFGASVFVFENSAFASEIQDAKVQILSDQGTVADSATITINLINQFDSFVTGGEVIATLPNGKEVHLTETTLGTFVLKVPEYCMGKKIKIEAYNGSKMKSKNLKVTSKNTHKEKTIKVVALDSVKPRYPGFI